MSLVSLATSVVNVTWMSDKTNIIELNFGYVAYLLFNTFNV